MHGVHARRGHRNNPQWHRLPGTADHSLRRAGDADLDLGHAHLADLLAALIAGLLEPESGTVHLAGRAVVGVDRPQHRPGRPGCPDAAGLARRCEIQLAYAIGVAEPVSVYVDTFGTGQVPDDRIARAVRDVFDFRPRSIIERLGLRSPIYRPTAAYGHFGREPQAMDVNGRTVQLVPWERTDRAEELRSAAG